MDYARNKRFFTFPGVDGVLAMIGIVIALLITLASLVALLFFWYLQDDFKVFLIVGLVLFVCSLVPYLIKYKRISKESELDMQVQDAINQLSKTALSKHGITEEQVQRSAPLVFGGYVLSEDITANLFTKRYVKREYTMTGGQGKTTATVVDPAVAMGSVMSASVITGGNIPPVKYKKGIKDVKVRTSVAEYTVLLFSEEKVFVYTLQFSLIDSEQKESLQSYSYQDIASISTEKSKYGSHIFVIKLSNGKVLSIPCCDEKAADIQGKVTTLMQLVRDKKR